MSTIRIGKCKHLLWRMSTIRISAQHNSNERF